MDTTCWHCKSSIKHMRKGSILCGAKECDRQRAFFIGRKKGTRRSKDANNAAKRLKRRLKSGRSESSVILCWSCKSRLSPERAARPNCLLCGSAKCSAKRKVFLNRKYIKPKLSIRERIDIILKKKYHTQWQRNMWLEERGLL